MTQLPEYETVYERGQWTAQHKRILCWRVAVYHGSCLIATFNTPQEAITFINSNEDVIL